MEEDKLEFGELLEQESEEYFWIRSGSIYRPSTIFQEIIYYYLEKLEASHQYYKVHQWPNTDIANNLQFLGFNHKRISFAVQPVEADPVDFRNQRVEDYADVAKLIVMVHAHYGLPEMSEANCPEVMNFILSLRNIAGQEVWIKRHYCLLDGAKRFNFYLAFRTRCLQTEFTDFFVEAVESFHPLDFKALYPDGFWKKLEGEPLLEAVLSHRNPKSYSNSLESLIRFARNLVAHYSKDSEGNPQTIREVEWKLFIRFPYLLHAICQTLMAVGMYYEFA